MELNRYRIPQNNIECSQKHITWHSADIGRRNEESWRKCKSWEKCKSNHGSSKYSGERETLPEYEPPDENVHWYVNDS